MNSLYSEILNNHVCNKKAERKTFVTLADVFRVSNRKV